MAELIAPVLTRLIAEFTCALGELRQPDGGISREKAMELCELSRGIRFELGPPEDANPSLVAEIVAGFGQAADVIEASTEDIVRVYAENIRMRAAAIDNR